MMNLSDEFWKRSEETSEQEVMNSGKIGVGVDLDRRLVVIGTGDGFLDLTMEMAEALSAGLMMASDALREFIANTN